MWFSSHCLGFSCSVLCFHVSIQIIWFPLPFSLLNTQSLIIMSGPWSALHAAAKREELEWVAKMHHVFRKKKTFCTQSHFPCHTMTVPEHFYYSNIVEKFLKLYHPQRDFHQSCLVWSQEIQLTQSIGHVCTHTHAHTQRYTCTGFFSHCSLLWPPALAEHISLRGFEASSSHIPN